METKRIDYKLIGEVIVGVILFFCVLHFIITPTVPMERKCGKVLTHSEKYVLDDNGGSNIEYYLNVDFKSQYFKEIKVTLKQYKSIKDGGRLCYNFPIETSAWYSIMNIIGLITIIGMIIFGAYVTYNIIVL